MGNPYTNTSADYERYLVALVLSCRASVSHINISSVELADNDHQNIWLCAEQLESTGEPANILTISDKLREKDIPCQTTDWKIYLESIAGDYRLFKNDRETIDNAVSRIKQARINNDVVKIAEDLSRNPKQAGEAIQALLEATSNNTNRQSTTLNDGVKKAVDQLGVYSKTHGATGAKTGLTELDEATGGFQPTDFIVVGARSAMGKTSFCQTCMQYAVKDGLYSGIISVEMPDMQLGMRHIAGHSGIDLKKIRNGGASDAEWAKVGLALKKVSNEERKPGTD